MKFFIVVLSMFLFSLKGTGQVALQLYGGEDHDVYLGCLNCDKYNSNSIWNAYGTFGSKYNSNSIWNSYGKFGGKYSSNSPFNTYASNPPVVVDKEGNFYGYFTVNKYNSKRSDSQLSLTIYNFWETIKEDVTDWYEKIFE